ncbi:MAG TPA: sulfatase-like hydrolase/transferase, partial [Agriterribacter sp.]
VYATPLPAVLRNNGYYTIHCGKAHWGAIATPGADPKNLGFDVNIAGHAAGGPATYQGRNDFGNNSPDAGKQVWAIPGLQKYWGQDINLSDALTREAMLAMDTALSLHKPFYLYLSHYAIHVPLEADHRYYKKYQDQGLPESEARYASMIEGMDKSLDDILNYIDEKGIAGNTIIIFMSDNGGLSAHARAGSPHTHNAPLNSGKGSAYEGGIREPMLVRWPGVTEGGSTCDQYIIAEDFFPTILSLAKIKTPETVQHVDGISFEDLLKNPQAKRKSRNLYWHFPNNWGPAGPGIGATSSIRSGNWKLIYYYKDARSELFNIKDDIGEKNNIAQKYPAMVKSLASRLTVYLKEVKAQRPVYKSNGKHTPWPGERASL